MTTDKPIKVLVVENSETILRLLCYHLENAGCQIETAKDGLDALILLEKFIPDILFTDIIMPKVSGDQLCNIVRSNNKFKNIFIAVHSSTSLEDDRDILNLDADIYIAKGPSQNIKKHIALTLTQFRQGVRRNQQTVGTEHLYPREITKELLLARKHALTIFSNIAEAVVEIDFKGKIVQANLAMENLVQKPSIQILSRPFISFLEGDEIDSVHSWIENAAEKDLPKYTSDYAHPLTIGNRSILLSMVRIKEIEDHCIIAILQDITHQKESEHYLESTIHRMNAILDSIDHGVVLCDADFKSLIVNQALKKIWHLEDASLPKQPTLHDLLNYIGSLGLLSLPVNSTEQDIIDNWLEKVIQGENINQEVERTDGKYLHFQSNILPDGGRLLTFHDITSMKEAAEKLQDALEKVQEQAYHDTLTGLPNLRLARERLISTISFSKRKKCAAALMFIDLDGFKEINDTHGHDIGDQVLIAVAERLSQTLRTCDTAARIGGDEFIVIQTEVANRKTVVQVAEKIIQTISAPILIEDISISVGASIGIAIYPDDGEESNILIKKADDAMYYTKRTGKNNYTFTPR